VTEAEAIDWLHDQFGVSRETVSKLEALRQMVIDENASQNLVSAASIDHMWARHIADSAQLLLHAPHGPWLDLGTGAGFPGLIVAIFRDHSVTCVESRRLRADFLRASSEQLGLTNVTVQATRLEVMTSQRFATISARAFAPMPKLLELAHRFSDNETIWVLPRGKSAKEELESVHASWQGAFHVKQSVTDADAAMIVASGVRRIKQARK
jgi:16S rRNA (guanine527-N7)-methyltransferase